MKKALAFVIMLVLAMSVFALASAEKTVHLYMASDTPTLNQHNSVETSLDTPISYCGATLYRAVADETRLNYEYIGEIASDLPKQIDDLTWEIPLRPEAKWANGDPINADTVMYSFKMLLDPNLANQMADFLSDFSITILNAKEYSKQTSDAPVAWEDVGIKKIDDYTIQIVTTSPVTQKDVCSHFTTRAVAMVYEPLYEQGMNETRTSTTYGSVPEMWMSAGPYKLDSWVHDSVQTYVRNENYWLPEYFHYDSVDVRVIRDMNARVELWEQGALDTLSPDINTIETYIDDPRLVEFSSITVFHIDVNCKNPENPLTASLNYRKALYHAMNREVIAKSIFGYQQPSGVYVNGQAGMFSGQIYRDSDAGKAVVERVESWGPAGYNPELAREYLKKAYEECGVPEDTVITLIMAFDESDLAWKATAEYLMEEFPVIFEGKINLAITTYAGISTTAFKETTDVWDLSPNDWSRSASRTYPYSCFYYYRRAYESHPNNYFDDEFEAQYDVCDSDEVKADYARMLEETAKLENIYLDKVIQIPMVQEISYQMFADRLELPVDTYVPGFGWGVIYGDIAE